MTEEHPETPARPSVFLYDPLDQEQTRLTALAHAAVKAEMDRAIAEENVRCWSVFFVELANKQLVAMCAVGQSSVTGHGKQGLRPGALALYRLLNDQKDIDGVYLVFVEGHSSWRGVWLHDLGQASPIQLTDASDPTSGRYGWSVRDMDKQTGPFVLPTHVPPPRERAQEGLI